MISLTTLGISSELLEREKAFRQANRYKILIFLTIKTRKKNKEIQNQTQKVVKKVEQIVQEGKQTLKRPVSRPVMSLAAENDLG